MKMTLVPLSSVTLQPAFRDRSYEATAGCEVKMIRCGVLLEMVSNGMTEVGKLHTRR